MRCFIIALALTAMSACSYNVQPTSAPAVNVYSSYDEKIPGNWAVVIDEDTTVINREISPSSYVCSAHNYPFSTGNTMTVSIQRTMSQIFEETVNRSMIPSIDEMTKSMMDGYVFVRLDSFSPRLSCSTGWWSAKCTSTVDLSFGIEAREVNGDKFATSVGSTKSFDGDGGGACGEASSILAEAYRLALKDAMERLAERASNSTRLRD